MQIAQTYRIETDRLVIRCYQPSDASKLKDAITESLDHLLPWMPWAKNEPEDLEAKVNLVRLFRGQFDLGKDYTFGIFDKTENDFIGSTGLHTRAGQNAREIGYWIHVNHINQGFALETVSALTKIAFEVEQLFRLEIHCDPENIRSQNIPKKLGYQLEGTLKKRITDANGDLKAAMIWTMFKSDYDKSKIREMNVKAFDVAGRIIHF